MKRCTESSAVQLLMSTIALSAIMVLQGCSTVSVADPKITASADYGEYPANYKEIVKQYFDATLIDPESARFQFGPEPTKAYTRNAIVPHGAQPVDFGYIVYVSVNAKNRMGGYTGAQLYRLLIRNGRVITRIQPNSLLPEPWYRE